MFGHKSFLRIGQLNDASQAGLLNGGYELMTCSYSFAQGTDQNGQVQTEVVGGIIDMVYPNIPTKELAEWMKASSKLLNGAIVICDADGTPLEKVLFEDAACVGMEINFMETGSSYTSTSFTLSARKIVIGAADKINKWVNIKN